MERSITLSGRSVPYTLKPNKRSKRISITMYPDGRIVVSIPVVFSEHKIKRFLKKSERWILKQIDTHEQSDAILIHSHKKSEQQLYREYAKMYIQKKVTEINTHYGFDINTIRVKNHKSQWGSASHKQNLNFNYKLIFLPPHLAEYVIAHEICHLGEMNHSKRFWELLEKAVSKPKKRDRELSQYHLV